MFWLSLSDLPAVGYRSFTASQVLSPYIYVFYAAYVVSFLLTPMMRAVAIHYSIIDSPDGLRKMHKTPVAYLGGVAVFMGWLTGLAVTQFLMLHRIEQDMPRHLVINFSIIVGAAVILLLGLWDDILRISPWAKIGGQVFAAVCLLWANVGVKSTWMFISPIQNKLILLFPSIAPITEEHWFVAASSYAFVIFIMVGCCNATNLLDGLDGLCGGVTAIIAAGFLFLAVHLGRESGALSIHDDALRVVLGLALLGAAIVFVQTRYAVAIYLVVFGSLIVAAYKMGMVHEKARSVVRQSLDPATSRAERPSPSEVIDVHASRT